MRYFLAFCFTLISLNSLAQITDSTFCEIPVANVTTPSFYQAIDSLIEYEKSNGRVCDEKSNIQAAYLSANKLLSIAKFEHRIDMNLPQSMLRKVRFIKYKGLTILLILYADDIPKWVQDGASSCPIPCHDDTTTDDEISDMEFVVSRTTLDAILQDGIFKILRVLHYQDNY